MKVIDLAKKVRNNEIMPKHIRYADEDLYFDGHSYYDKEGNNDILDILAMQNNSLYNLFDEVEIIEEDKKIRKLPKEVRQPNNFEEVVYIAEDLVNKINEIIDYLEEKE